MPGRPAAVFTRTARARRSRSHPPRTSHLDGSTTALDTFATTVPRPDLCFIWKNSRNGDAILEVNGQVLDGMATVLRLFSNLQATPRVTLTVVREGRRVTVAFDTK